MRRDCSPKIIIDEGHAYSGKETIITKRTVYDERDDVLFCRPMHLVHFEEEGLKEAAKVFLGSGSWEDPDSQGKKPLMSNIFLSKKKSTVARDDDEEEGNDAQKKNSLSPSKTSPLGKKPLTIQELMKLQNLDVDDDDEDDDEN